ncbi:hypothetical protein R1sor_009391 [Riccia sorocarpa]|uniref:Glycosyltransferase family 92 protein n=1 Tax=Riccia sorocarpa TaxID=122646 RepID=A0ABD3HYZ4_9MARC
MEKGNSGKPSWKPFLAPHSKLVMKSKSPEMKITIGVVMIMGIAAVVMSSYYLPFDDLNSLLLCRKDYHCNEQLQKLHMEQHKQGQNHMRHIFAADDDYQQAEDHLQRNSTSELSEQLDQEQQVVSEPHILREWEMPAVTETREWEDDQGYGIPTRFVPMGTASFLWIHFSAYRGSSNSFAVVGLGPKPLHVYGDPGFECYWEPEDAKSMKIVGNVTVFLPDWGFGRQYTTVVLNCTFESDVGVNGTGGQLEVVATHGSLDTTGLQDVRYVALTEQPGEYYNDSIFHAPFKYEYLYCGSPWFGVLSPQRIREWLSYTMMVLGPLSHFILYDAGGIEDEHRRILNPWIKMGRVTLMNLRGEARYDAFYYNQFLVVNDCLFRSKTLANWTFYFDADEYVHIHWNHTLDSIMKEIQNSGVKGMQVMFEQRPMHHNSCVANHPWITDRNESRLWTMEKLTYRRTQITEAQGHMNMKYAIQAKYAMATGVHRSENLMFPRPGMDPDEVTTFEDWRMHYYHYHNTINHLGEVCLDFIDASVNETKLQNVTHIFDDTMVWVAPAVKQFELKMIGQLPPVL